MADTKASLNDSAHGAEFAKKPSQVEAGVIGKHGSTSPLMEIVHNGMLPMPRIVAVRKYTSVPQCDGLAADL